MRLTRLLLLLLAVLCLLAACAFAEEEDELSIEDNAPPDTLITRDPNMTPRPRRTAEPVVTPTPAPAFYETDGTILLTLTFGGDLCLGADPREADAFERERERQQGSYSFPLRNLRDIFRQDDLTVISLKTSLTDAADIPENRAGGRVYRADPRYASALYEAGVEVVVTANDHSLDFGEEGLAATQDALRRAGLTVSAEGQLAVYTVKSLRVAVLSYNAVDRAESVLRVLPEDLAVVRSLSDIAVVYFHWGTERSYLPDDSQIALGRRAAECGADLVLGSRSTHINPIEDYHGAYIVYSMGSLSSIAPEKPGDMSAFLFQIRFRYYRGETTRMGFRLIPIRIATSTEQNDYCPTPLTKDTAVDSVITTLMANGQQLEFAVKEYLTEWR